jgi:hypothetical protein
VVIFVSFGRPTRYDRLPFFQFQIPEQALKDKVEELDKLEEGTLGKEIAKCLKENNLNLVPNYESHDLKHSLLNFIGCGSILM